MGAAPRCAKYSVLRFVLAVIRYMTRVGWDMCHLAGGAQRPKPWMH